jgi:hypothetical protein
MQKYIKDESTGKFFENPEFDSLFKILSVTKNHSIILEKQYVFTEASSIIPELDL